MIMKLMAWFIGCQYPDLLKLNSNNVGCPMSSGCSLQVVIDISVVTFQIRE